MLSLLFVLIMYAQAEGYVNWRKCDYEAKSNYTVLWVSTNNMAIPYKLYTSNLNAACIVYVCCIYYVCIYACMLNVSMHAYTGFSCICCNSFPLLKMTLSHS